MNNLNIVAPAVYETQVDNIFDGGVTCAVTTLSMLIQSKGVKDGQEPRHIEDDILVDLKKTYTDATSRREDFLFLAKYAKDKYGVALKYQACNKQEWLAKFINETTVKRRPFMTSTSNALTRVGHICLARGVKAEGGVVSLYFNDPYGEWPYKVKGKGERVLYPEARFPEKDTKGVAKIYHTLCYA